MFKKLRRTLLILAAAGAMLVPVAGVSATYPEHVDHIQVRVEYHHRHCWGGYRDRWGHWHPYRCRW